MEGNLSHRSLNRTPDSHPRRRVCGNKKDSDIARIEEVDPLLRAVTEIDQDTLSVAAELARIRRGADDASSLGALHPIPILLKGTMATEYGMKTTAVSYMLLGAGTIILGRANMSDWSSAPMPCSCSVYGGQTIGAYRLGQDPSGLSSGSAVASSLGPAWASLGTETSGSITHPAHMSGIVGMKPMDTVSAMARIIKDAVYLLSVVVGCDSHDNYTKMIPFEDDKMPDYVAACKKPGLHGKRLGVIWELVYEDNIDETAIPAPTCSTRRSFFCVRPDRVHESHGWMRLCRNLPAYLGKLETDLDNVESLVALRDFARSHPLERYRVASPDDTPVRQSGDGTSPNVPYGPGFAGDKFSETKAFAMAYAFEQRTRVRGSIEPYVRPTTELTEVVRR
ncbi:hypothetical protein Purlil1_1043 [Purpureocillium lilacinum]|uniref:Amidase domain-containing protein n=1 Tax=Purpureocillium lilacinum TaxID=33203 RepID=A0ABR0CDC7_PURLI|nr:hypothetical protein Purlil1_1043 [Purpureocillium lilacinum]